MFTSMSHEQTRNIAHLLNTKQMHCHKFSINFSASSSCMLSHRRCSVNTDEVDLCAKCKHKMLDKFPVNVWPFFPLSVSLSTNFSSDDHWTEPTTRGEKKMQSIHSEDFGAQKVNSFTLNEEYPFDNIFECICMWSMHWHLHKYFFVLIPVKGTYALNSFNGSLFSSREMQFYLPQFLPEKQLYLVEKIGRMKKSFLI